MVTEGIVAGTSIISGILNYMAAADAQEKNLAGDRLDKAENQKDRMARNALSERELANRERTQAFKETESKLNRAENAEQRGYNRIQNTYNRGADLWTQSMNAQRAKVAPLIRRV